MTDLQRVGEFIQELGTRVFDLELVLPDNMNMSRLKKARRDKRFEPPDLKQISGSKIRKQPDCFNESATAGIGNLGGSMTYCGFLKAAGRAATECDKMGESCLSAIGTNTRESSQFLATLVFNPGLMVRRSTRGKAALRPVLNVLYNYVRCGDRSNYGSE